MLDATLDATSTERTAAFRMRCLELAADYCTKSGRGEPIDLAQRFEAYALNNLPGTCSGAPATIAGIEHKP